MKNRDELIEAVKVKLEEISPFEEPNNFIKAGDTAINSIKPIISYIERTLDEAAHNCLRSLPLMLLHADIQSKTDGFSVDKNGVGFVTGINATYRYVRFHHAAMQRDITAFVSSENPMYLLQQNRHVHGGTAKPVAVLASFHDGTNAGQLEIYSFTPKMAERFRHSWKNTNKKYLNHSGPRRYHSVFVLSSNASSPSSLLFPTWVLTRQVTVTCIPFFIIYFFTL